MKTLAFAGSNSTKSINHEIVKYVASLTEDASVIRLTDFSIPMYGIDEEVTNGIPEDVQKLHDEIKASDLIILSVNEHNGNISAFFKNILDWLSRVDRKLLTDKKVLLLSASTGKGGATAARSLMEKSLPHFGATIIGAISVPSFGENFADGKLLNSEIDAAIREALAQA